MTPMEMLLDALSYYEIDTVGVNGNTVLLHNNYEVEVESNGLYKLLQDKAVISPFDDLEELCLFVLRK
jgi:hypothetical protein